MWKYALTHVIVLILAYVLFRYHAAQVGNEFIADSGQRILQDWDTLRSEVESTQWKQPNTRLYGYFFGGILKDGLNTDTYHFESADLLLSMNRDYEKFFTETVLKNDFSKLWASLEALHNGNATLDNLQIRKWGYRGQNSVSITFFQDYDRRWYVWVIGYNDPKLKQVDSSVPALAKSPSQNSGATGLQRWIVEYRRRLEKD